MRTYICYDYGVNEKTRRCSTKTNCNVATKTKNYKMKWTKLRLEALKRATDRAQKHDQTEFVFAGREYLVGYAKYLIRYLHETINKTPQRTSQS